MTPEQKEETFVTLDELCGNVSLSLFKMLRQSKAEPEFEMDLKSVNDLTRDLTELCSIVLDFSEKGNQKTATSYKINYTLVELVEGVNGHEMSRLDHEPAEMEIQAISDTEAISSFKSEMRSTLNRQYIINSITPCI